MFPNELNGGDVAFVLLFIAALIALVLLVRILPKEDLGPDPDRPREVKG